MHDIRPATHDDLPALRALYLAAMRGLHDAGVNQWTEDYPVSLLPDDIARGDLYVLDADGEPAAAVALNTQADSWHEGVPWTHPDAFYIHRLAVHPDRQGGGLAKFVMEWAHKTARERGGEWMHLDTNLKNVRAVALYHGLGYHDVSVVEEYGGRYVCMERPLAD